MAAAVRDRGPDVEWGSLWNGLRCDLHFFPYNNAKNIRFIRSILAAGSRWWEDAGDRQEDAQ